MNIAIVGAGKIVYEMLEVVSKIKDINIDSLYSRSDKDNHVTKLCSKYNISNMYMDYDKMLQNDNIDIVYVALCNNLHYEFTKKALLMGKSVICEKPFTVTYKGFLELRQIAKSKDLFLFEAITSLYLPNFIEIQKRIEDIGNIKLVECNFSQYSSRYDEFKKGREFPVFKKENAGGALMDLNVYNIHVVCMLFGMPKEVIYYPSIENGIDVSGILILKFQEFLCSLIASKACNGKASTNIQGDRGYINIPSPLNSIDEFFVSIGDTTKKYNYNDLKNRMYYEFIEFNRMFTQNDKTAMNKKLDQSENAMKVISKARKYLN